MLNWNQVSLHHLWFCLWVPSSMKILNYFKHHHHLSIIPSIWGMLKYFFVAKYPKLMLPSLFLEEGWIFVRSMSSAVCFSIKIYIELSFNRQCSWGVLGVYTSRWHVYLKNDEPHGGILFPKYVPQIMSLMLHT